MNLLEENKEQFEHDTKLIIKGNLSSVVSGFLKYVLKFSFY